MKALTLKNMSRFGGGQGPLPPALDALTLSLPLNGGIGAGTFARTSVAWNPETGAQVLANIPRYVGGKSGSAILEEGAVTNLLSQADSISIAASATCTTTATTHTVSCKTGSLTLSGTMTGTVTPSTPRIATATAGTLTLTGTATGVQVEARAYKTSWQEGGTPRTAETFSYPTSGILANPPSAGTVACWVYIDPVKVALSAAEFVFFAHVSSGNNDRIILEKQSGAANRYALITRSGGGTQSISTFDITLSAGWHHFAGTWNSTESAVWVDGVKSSSPVPSPNVPAALGANMYIGVYSSGISQVDMPIDGFKLYSRALTSAEVAQLYRYGR